MKDSKLVEIVNDIYRELYLKSTPSADFDKLVFEAKILENGMKEIPYNNYEIDEKEAEEIILKYSKKLSKWDRRRVSTTVYLGCSPKFKYSTL